MNLDETGWDEVPVAVERYRIRLEKAFRDGFKLEAGSELRKVIGSKEECGYLNVIFEGDHSVKRMFWIEKSELEFQSSEEELWSGQKFREETKDRLENWFE